MKSKFISHFWKHLFHILNTTTNSPNRWPNWTGKPYHGTISPLYSKSLTTQLDQVPLDGQICLQQHSIFLSRLHVSSLVQIVYSYKAYESFYWGNGGPLEGASPWPKSWTHSCSRTIQGVGQQMTKAWEHIQSWRHGLASTQHVTTMWPCPKLDTKILVLSALLNTK